MKNIVNIQKVLTKFLKSIDFVNNLSYTLFHLKVQILFLSALFFVQLYASVAHMKSPINILHGIVPILKPRSLE